MTKVPENFCILPFLSIEVATRGNMRVCCLNTEQIQHQGRQLNINQDSLMDGFHSTTMEGLRSDFLDNKRPNSCKTCWDVESSGGDSKRLQSNTQFKWFVQKANHYEPNLHFLDLKMGNICNLKCRICNTFCSSKWASDSLALDSSNFNKSQVNRVNTEARWPRTSIRFWNDLQKVVDSTHVIYFAGGEPMLIKEHFDLLRYCIETKNASRISLRYNTNGTQLPQDAIENIWPKFRKVELGFSIDGTEDEFEYQRDGANWQEVNKNIENTHTARNSLPSLRTQLCTTVSILHVTTLIDTLKWGESRGFNTIVINLLHNPDYFCIRNLSHTAKIRVAELLESRLDEIANGYLQKQVRNVISFMMLPGQDLTVKCLDRLEKIDLIRLQDWRIALPKLRELLNDA
jgi:organic radical activating enzyme